MSFSLNQEFGRVSENNLGRKTNDNRQQQRQQQHRQHCKDNSNERVTKKH